MRLYIKDCEKTGHDPVQVRKLARRLEAVAAAINALGLEIFGAEGRGLYIIDPSRRNIMSHAGEPHVLADCEEPANGGANQCREMPDGTHALCG